MVEIREFDPARDHEAVRYCFVELQEVERALDPAMPSGEEIADAYLELMFKRCMEFDGEILVAESGGAIVGFVTVWRRYRSEEPDDDPSEHAYIADLVVAETHRGRGIGRRLLRHAESRARDAGNEVLRLSLKAGNLPAAALYAAEGFEESEILLQKKLT